MFLSFFLVRSRIPWSRISTRAVLWLGKWTEGKRERKFKRITGTGNRRGKGRMEEADLSSSSSAVTISA